MKFFLKTLLLSLVLSSLCASKEDLEPFFHQKRDTIRILLFSQTDPFLLDVKGASSVTDALTGKVLERSFFPTQKTISASMEGISWKSFYKNHYQIKITPRSKETKIIVAGKQIFGDLIFFNVNHTLHVVVEMPIETYLEQKMTYITRGLKLSMNVLEALLINERTNLLYWVNHRRSPYFDIIDEKENFSLCENFVCPSHQIQRARHNTENLVLLYEDQLFPTIFCKNSCGQTISFAKVAGLSTPTPTGILTPHAAAAKGKNVWKCYAKKEDFEKALDITGFSRIDIYQESGSQKVYAVSIKSSSGKKTYSFLDFQKKMGEERIKSNLFHVKKIGPSFVFEGYGEGSGAGICLFEAEQLAKSGHSATEILDYFYPSSSIARLKSD